MSTTALFFILAIVPCFCQRPFYAGIRPVGFPTLPVNTGLLDRFQNEPIPAQLNGDRITASQLFALPVENQPFYFVNRDQIAALLANPPTYPLRPSTFNENANRI